MPTTTQATDRARKLADLRRSVYEAGELRKTDGTALTIVPHTPHPDDGDALRDIVADAAPTRTIEIGCATGLSTLTIFEGLALAGTDGAHTVVDPYFHAHWGGAAGLLMERAGIRDRVTVDERESVVALAERLGTNSRFDLAFIDGCHWFECALTDIWLLTRLVEPGGLIVVDDPWMPAVARAIQYASDNLACEHAATHRRNGKPRLAALRSLGTAGDRNWDHYTDFEGAAAV